MSLSFKKNPKLYSGLTTCVFAALGTVGLIDAINAGTHTGKTVTGEKPPGENLVRLV